MTAVVRHKKQKSYIKWNTQLKSYKITNEKDIYTKTNKMLKLKLEIGN